MAERIFPQGPGHWYRGNLHSHTRLSDGWLTPAEDKQLYRHAGYSFLCVSDHDLYTDFRSELDEEDFIILPGVECSASLYTADGRQRLKTHHLHGILGNAALRSQATLPLFEHRQQLEHPCYYGSWDGAAVAQSITDQLRARGCLVGYNHPLWSRVEEAEFIHTQGLWAVEVFNYGTQLESRTGWDSQGWERMLRRGTRVNCFASDDNHNGPALADSHGGWVEVWARELTHEAVTTALAAGSYYSSAGPRIRSWGVQDGLAFAECSPVEQITFFTGNRLHAGATVHARPGQPGLERAEFPLQGDEAYLRVECLDRQGRVAWSNPLYF